MRTWNTTKLSVILTCPLRLAITHPSASVWMVVESSGWRFDVSEYGVVITCPAGLVTAAMLFAGPWHWTCWALASTVHAAVKRVAVSASRRVLLFRSFMMCPPFGSEPC